MAAEFLDTYPQHRLDGRIAKIEADREALAAKLQHRLKRGDFNLGRIGDERQRENLARRYVEAAEALRGFSSELKLLERARELAPQWQEQLSEPEPSADRARVGRRQPGRTSLARPAQAGMEDGGAITLPAAPIQG